jgi:hypothetical protein
MKLFNPNSALENQININSDWNDAIGPAPSIGIRWIATNQIQLQECTGLPGSIKSTGKTTVNKKDEIYIRITCLSNYNNLINNEKNGKKSICFRVSINGNGYEARGEKLDNNQNWEWRVFSVFDGRADYETTNINLTVDGGWKTLLSILQIWVAGYFYIHAIRPLIDSEDQLLSKGDIVELVNKLPNKRHVGIKGENTLAVQRYYEDNFILNPRAGRPLIATDSSIAYNLGDTSYLEVARIPHPNAFLCRMIGHNKLWEIFARVEISAWNLFKEYLLTNRVLLIKSVPLIKPLIDSVTDFKNDDQFDKIGHAILEEQQRLSVWREISNYKYPDEDPYYAWFSESEHVCNTSIYKSFLTQWNQLGESLYKHLIDRHSELAAYCVNSILNNQNDVEVDKE